MNRWVPLTKIEEGKNPNTNTNPNPNTNPNIFNKILPFIRPLKLWIRDFTSARTKDKTVVSESEPEQVIIVKEEPKVSRGPQSKFEIRLEELGKEFEKRLQELEEEVEEEKPEPNPFLNFKLDRDSLKEAFTFN